MRQWWIGFLVVVMSACSAASISAQEDFRKVTDLIPGLVTARMQGEISHAESDELISQFVAEQMASEFAALDILPDNPRPAFDQWFARLIGGDTESEWTAFRFAAIHRDDLAIRSAVTPAERERMGPTLGLLLSRAIETNPAFGRTRPARALAIRALASTSLTPDELSDPMLSRQVSDVLASADYLTELFLERNIASIPEDARRLWYQPVSRLLRSSKPEDVILGCRALSGLRAVSENDRAYLRQLLTDLATASPELAKGTRLEPIERSLAHPREWPRMSIRTAAMKCLIWTCTDADAEIRFLNELEASARWAAAIGIIEVFASREIPEIELWSDEDLHRLFAWLRGFLSESASKPIVIDRTAGTPMDITPGEFGRSVLQDLMTPTDQVSVRCVALLRDAAITAAEAHCDPETAGSIRQRCERMMTEFNEAVSERGKRILTNCSTQLELAERLREAYENNEITMDEVRLRRQQARDQGMLER